MMAARARCSQACEECKRRKERCDGHSPCLHCTRRNRVDACIFGSTDGSQASPLRPRKRRRLTHTASTLAEGRIPVSIPPAFHGTSAGQTIFTGSSGSLAFLKAVGTCAADSVPDDPFVVGCRGDFLLEDLSSEIQAGNRKLEVSSEHSIDLARAFLGSTRGIFDLFDDGDLLDIIAKFALAPDNKTTLKDSVLLLVLAIGAQQRGTSDDQDICEGLFLDAQKIATRYMLEPPSIELVQAFILIALYLFVVCRRNAAFMHLGVALRASESIGLHRTETFVLLSLEDERVWSRTWKCLRILDLSSCAALGRTLATRGHRAGITAIEGSSSCGADSHVLAAEIDSAGMKLCRIAETILVEVYEADNLTTELAYKISQDLRDWTHDLPDILTSGNTDGASSDANLPDALCLNSLTGAYYWTTQLLTRPFLLAAVRCKQNQRNSAASTTIEHLSPFADACINSAFRCLHVTSKLTQYKSLPKRLFLVNNTTLVSALVLGLAFFGDYDQHFPLESGLQKALSFLLHMTADRQAQHYAKIVSALISAGNRHVQQRNANKLALRSAQVEEMFGSVHQKHEARRRHAYGQHVMGQTDREFADARAGVSPVVDDSVFDPGNLTLLSPAAGLEMFQVLDDFTWTV